MKRFKLNRNLVSPPLLLLSRAEIAGFYFWPWRPLGALPFPLVEGRA